MNKYILSIKLILLLCLSLKAQTSDVNIKVITETKNEPLMGATVYFEAFEKGVVTDFDGIAKFTEIPNGQHQIIISFLGFETLEVVIQVPSDTDLILQLKEGGNELDAIVEELGEKAIMTPTNISMVLRESTGIQMQQTSLSSGSTNIRIQGLDGRYTQLLRDGFPLYGGFSSGLSILQIPPLDFGI